TPHFVINLEILLYGIPRLLWNNQNAYPQFCHNRHGFGGDGGSIGAALERACGERTDFTSWLLCDQTAFHIAGLKGFEDQLGILNETAAPFVLVEPESFILNSCQPTTKPENKPAIG